MTTNPEMHVEFHGENISDDDAYVVLTLTDEEFDAPETFMLTKASHPDLYDAFTSCMFLALVAAGGVGPVKLSA